MKGVIPIVVLCQHL